MLFIPDNVIDNLIAEDVPYFDLTTWGLGFGNAYGIIEYFTREDMVLCGSEEVERIFHKLSITPIDIKPSGAHIKAGESFIKATGIAENLHMAWKVGQNILDHCSGISTKTDRMIQKAQAINPHIMIVTTRKGFPGAKALMTKAVLTGGAFPHRLGLSETVLVFKQHMNFLGGLDGFIQQIPELKIKVCEKKLIVEAESLESAIKLCNAGVDGLQFDKFSVSDLTIAVRTLKEINPSITILGAGGINEKNIEEYASTGIHAIVTTNMYDAPPIDIGVKLYPTTV